MSCEVYANNMSIACKVADGKSIAAFPDVCFTPPQTPATPPGVPIPYPNTGMASDTANGSKTVLIGGKEVMLKNKSYFKTSTGDEAGCAPKKGIITSKIKGKLCFVCWSMNVKFEGLNVPRHLDLMGHNEASDPTNVIVWPYIDKMAFGSSASGPCQSVAKGLTDECEEHVVKNKKQKVMRLQSLRKMCADPDCAAARKCVLTPKSPSNCCPQPQPKPPSATPHHIVPASQFVFEGAGPIPLSSGAEYSYDKAPCICVDGTSHSFGKHGEIHEETNNLTVNHPSVLKYVNPSGKSISPDARWKVSEAEAVGAEATATVTGCDQACIESQLRKGHDDMKQPAKPGAKAKPGVQSGDQIRPTTAGEVTKPPIPPPTSTSVFSA